MLRTTTLIMALVLLAAPAAAVFSVRPVQNAVMDLLPPQSADQPAVPVPADINFEEQQSPGENDGDNRLWMDGDGEVIAAQPSFYECGATEGLSVAIQNPYPVHVPQDADPFTQGVLRADGSFYVIPEFSGERADEIKSVWFEFLENVPSAGELAGPDTICDATGDATATATGGLVGAGTGGVYYPFYRGDTDPSDGWIIPVNTLLVPDNIYAGVLRVYGEPATDPVGGTTLLASGFVYAIVDNLGDNDEAYQPCQPPGCGHRDLTPPWPSIVPGDVSIDAAGGDPHKLVVEYGENVKIETLSVEVCDANGQNCAAPTGDIGPSTPRDVDSVPILTIQTTSYGDMVTFDLDEALSPGDVIRATATDLAGNTITKEVTIPA